MPKIKIEEYRGFEIVFDIITGMFSAWNDFYDTEFTKKNFDTIKSGVDKYIKDNAGFEPFDIVLLHSYGSTIDTIGETVKITGIRKDGRLVFVAKDGKKRQLTSYDAEKYYLSFPELPAARKIYEFLMNEQKAAQEHCKKQTDLLFKELPALTPVSEKIKELMKNS